MTTGHVSIRIYWLHCGGTPFKGSTEAARLSREAGLCGWRPTGVATHWSSLSFSHSMILGANSFWVFELT
jgi:hypothetical protein